MNKFAKTKHANLPLAQLKRHPVIQRKFDPNWAKHIKDNFDPDKFGEIAVVKTGDEYFVFDGQHRCWSAKEALGEDQVVPCLIYEDLPEERQAELFLGRNNAKAVRAIDKFKMAVVSGDAKAVRITEILHSLKLKVGEQRTKGQVQATSALLKVFEKYGEATLLRALRVIQNAWDRDIDAYDGIIIRSVSQFLYKVRVDDAELARKLMRDGGPSRLLGAARDHAKTMGMNVERAAAERLLNIYNKGRRANVVSWDDRKLAA